MTPRGEYIKKCKKDKNFLDEHIKGREQYIDLQKSAASDLAAGKTRKNANWDRGAQRLEVEEGEEEKLRRPDDTFLPWEEYKDTFGDPTLQKNKKRGHRVSTISGVKGVLMPAPRGTPWKLSRASVRKLSKKEVLDNGTGSPHSTNGYFVDSQIG